MRQGEVAQVKARNSAARCLCREVQTVELEPGPETKRELARNRGCAKTTMRALLSRFGFSKRQGSLVESSNSSCDSVGNDHPDVVPIRRKLVVFAARYAIALISVILAA